MKCDRAGVRVFVVDSDERRAYETRMREKSMERTRAGLERVRTRVAQGRLKRPEKIGAAVERVLQRNHGHRYYDWELKEGQLRFFEHPVNLPREKKYEGKYLIQTDQPDLKPQDAVAQYKELNEVERGFHALKDPIGMRPIWHRVERRVRGAHLRGGVGVLVGPNAGARVARREGESLVVGCVASTGNHPSRSLPHQRRHQNGGHTRQPASPPSSAGPQAD